MERLPAEKVFINMGPLSKRELELNEGVEFQHARKDHGNMLYSYVVTFTSVRADLIYHSNLKHFGICLVQV